MNLLILHIQKFKKLLMLIINSSNYIPESFAYEFGEIPDIFLPIGNTRLIDILIKRLYENVESIFIIIPHNFNKEKIIFFFYVPLT